MRCLYVHMGRTATVSLHLLKDVNNHCSIGAKECVGNIDMTSYGQFVNYNHKL